MAQFSYIENAQGQPVGCYDNVNHQICPISLCNQQYGLGMQSNPIVTGLPKTFTTTKKVTYRNFLGSEKATLKSNGVYAASLLAFALGGYFIAKKSGNPEVGVLLGAGVGLAGGMVINSFIKK